MDEIAAREALVTGAPQRIEPPKVLTDEMRELAAPPPGYGNPGELVENYAVLAHAPELLRVIKPMGTYFLVHGTLTPRMRELAILRIAWLCRSPYEWGEHVVLAKRIGMTDAEVAAARVGSGDAVWDAADGAVLKAVEELYADAMISDATWEALSVALDEGQRIELLTLVGQYQALAYFFNSLRLRLRPGNTGLAAK